MKLIVGLGNPGAEYTKTRHNVGFLVIDELISQLVRQGAEVLSRTSDASCERQDLMMIMTDGRREKLVVIKPLTYMNRSGEVVRAVRKLLPAEMDLGTDLIVIHDELDLNLGRVKVDFGASAAGHNGVKNIIDQLGTKDFIRIRVGIRPMAGFGAVRMEDFVLERFASAEQDEVNEVIVKAAETTLCVLENGLTAAQERYNQKTA